MSNHRGVNECCLYFVYNPKTELVKIGRTDDFPRRLVSLQSASGVKLEVLGKAYGAAHLEMLLFNVLAPLRERGEWFRKSDELMQLAHNATARDVERFIFGKLHERALAVTV